MIDKLKAEIFQVLVVARDVDRTAREWAAVFGRDVPESVRLDPEEIAHAKYRGRSTGTRAKIIPFIHRGGVDIEVIQPDDEPSIWQEFLEHDGEGVSHIGVWVNDMAEAIEFLSKTGYLIAHQASFTGGSYTIMDTKMNLGVNIMLKHLDAEQTGGTELPGGVVKGTSTIDPNRMCQVALVVRDIEKTAGNLCAIFGLPMPETFTLPPAAEAHTRFRGKPTKTRARLAVLKMGPVVLELTQPDSEPSSWKEFLDGRGEGVHHIGFMVDDLPGTLSFLQKRGISERHSGDYPGGRYVFVESAEKLGVIVNVKHDS
jgi:methylmalonyl-CoA/ethylmalonyl-CoA epimerase